MSASDNMTQMIKGEIPLSGQLCDFCWDDDGVETPAYAMHAGVPLCLKHLGRGDSNQKFATPPSFVVPPRAEKKVDGRSKPRQNRSDGNNYTPLTDDQISEIRRLKGEGLTNRQITAQMNGVKEWRVQQAAADVRHATDGDVINRTENNPYDGTHLRAESVTSAPVMTREEYTIKFGALGKRELAQSTLDMWRKIESLNVGCVLILLMKANETTNSARARYANLLTRCVREFKPKFKLKIVGRQAHRHVVLLKEAIQ